VIIDWFCFFVSFSSVSIFHIRVIRNKIFFSGFFWNAELTIDEDIQGMAEMMAGRARDNK
jgi:hypothetical protein